MLLFILAVSAFLGIGLASAEKNRATVVMCSSFSCAYNKRARCTRGEVAIYDNTVIGLCLYHTENMGERILEPMNKGMAVERGKPYPQMINKIMNAREDKRDSELVHNPKAFERWIKKQMKKRGAEE